ncbi:MAG: right-handed parallel beta-helix repeat-containing protein, partial [candidate division Zixibacteria bacterium]|nr:right-handed parallel beta-helix repeat-containing protein [candidate division Zixibacteria bacterium]
MKIIYALFSTLLLLVSPMYAINYFVTESGNNTNDGLDSTTAWASIDRGDQLSILVPGDTVKVMPGLYNLTASATFNQSGTAGIPIVYQGFGVEPVIFDGGGNNIPLFELDASNTVFSRINLRNTSDNGIDISGADNLIKNCAISQISTYGIYLKAGAANNLIYNNTIYETSSTAVYPVSSVKTTRIINNIMVSMPEGIWAASGTIAAHNNMWLVSSPYNGGVTDSAGGLSVDPQFTDTTTGDFSLQSGSLCIDAGMDIGHPFEGSSPDMGAIEYTPPTVNVYWVSPSGSDSNDGLDSTSAWATIDNGDQKSLLAPGDTINILSGTYFTSTYIDLVQSGTALMPIVYQNFSDGNVIVDIGGVATSIIWLQGNHIVIDGLELINSGHYGIYIDGDSSIIKNCRIHDILWSGINVNFGDENIILNNIVHNLGETGI